MEETYDHHFFWTRRPARRAWWASSLIRPNSERIDPDASSPTASAAAEINTIDDEARTLETWAGQYNDVLDARRHPENE